MWVRKARNLADSIMIQRLSFKNLIIGHLKSNSIRNKLEVMANIISNFNIFLISGLKLDSSFPNSQFKINGYKIFIRDRNRHGVFLYM